MEQQYAILTGAYGAIGSAIAEGLAKQGFTLSFQPGQRSYKLIV